MSWHRVFSYPAYHYRQKSLVTLRDWMGFHCNREVARHLLKNKHHYHHNARSALPLGLSKIERFGIKPCPCSHTCFPLRGRFFARTPEKNFSLTWAEKSLMFIVYSVKSVLKLKVVRIPRSAPSLCLSAKNPLFAEIKDFDLSRPGPSGQTPRAVRIDAPGRPTVRPEPFSLRTRLHLPPHPTPSPSAPGSISLRYAL